jgi:ATP-dependent Clp protease ATP-binding subunit ClpA
MIRAIALIGRATETRLLGEMLGSAGRGSSAVVVIVGDAGVGKTALIVGLLSGDVLLLWPAGRRAAAGGVQ